MMRWFAFAALIVAAKAMPSIEKVLDNLGDILEDINGSKDMADSIQAVSALVLVLRCSTVCALALRCFM